MKSKIAGRSCRRGMRDFGRETMVVSVLTCGVHQSAGGRELRASGGLRAGEESGDGAGPLGWLGRGGPFPIFFVLFLFRFSVF